MPDGSKAPEHPRVLEEVHAVAGRLRLRSPAALSGEDAVALADRLSAVAGVQRVVVRPNTGSVILTFEGDIDTMRARLAAEPGLKLAKPPTPPPVRQIVQLGMWKLDARIKEQTGDALDLRSGLAVLLLAMAAAQAVRGRIAGPSTSLALAALTLLDMNKGK
jgi:hypothetical protein